MDPEESPRHEPPSVARSAGQLGVERFELLMGGALGPAVEHVDAEEFINELLAEP